MKNRMLLIGAIIITLVLPEFVTAQKFSSLDVSPADIAYLRPGGRNATPVAKVTYSRPQLKGREMLGKVEPYGKVWRAGANEATEIRFYKDVTVGDKKVKAGTYSMYAIPNEDKWTIILNSKLDTWGAYSYDESLDIARVDVPVQKTDSPVEAFSITFDTQNNESKMFMAWEDVQVGVPIIH